MQLSSCSIATASASSFRDLSKSINYSVYYMYTVLTAVSVGPVIRCKETTGISPFTRGGKCDIIMREKLTAVVEELQNCKSLDELFKIDDLVVDDPIAMEAEYREAFDAAEAFLNAQEAPVVVEEVLPETVAELQALVRQLQARPEYLLVADHVEELKKQKKENPRPTVSYQVLRRDVQFTQPQAQAIADGIIATGKRELTESEVYKLIWRLRNEGLLGGGQSPVRIFKWYLGESTIGYKARGFLKKLG
jgi:hypothetical protein